MSNLECLSSAWSYDSWLHAAINPSIVTDVSTFQARKATDVNKKPRKSRKLRFLVAHLTWEVCFEQPSVFVECAVTRLMVTHYDEPINRYGCRGVSTFEA